MFDRIKMTASENLKLPKDVVLGEVLVSLVGRCSVVVENYRGILVYNDSVVKLQAKNCRLSIYGKRLNIEYYNHDEMKITGQIQSLDFSD